MAAGRAGMGNWGGIATSVTDEAVSVGMEREG